MTRLFDPDETGGPDPLDTRRAPAVGDFRLARLLRRLRTSGALGLPRVLAPALLFVPLGFLLGPLGLNLLRAPVLAHLGPATSVGLATLGVFVGLGLTRRTGRGTWLLFAASLESGVTVGIVGLAVSLLVALWQMPIGIPASVAGLILGICAAASSAGYEDRQPGTLPSLAARIASLDDVLPIVAGGMVLAAVHAVPLQAAWLMAVTALLGACVGVIGALLIGRAASDAERTLFVIGALALSGGAAGYLGLSPLLSGLGTGIVWNFGPGRVGPIVRRDVRRYQHPLVVLVLLAAGASARPTLEAVWLCAPFVLFRMTGKITGGWVASWIVPAQASGDLGAHLLAPGLMGIAFALAANGVIATGDGTALLTAVVIGTLVSELVALSVAPGGRPQPAAEAA